MLTVLKITQLKTNRIVLVCFDWYFDKFFRCFLHVGSYFTFSFSFFMLLLACIFRNILQSSLFTFRIFVHDTMSRCDVLHHQLRLNNRISSCQLSPLRRFDILGLLSLDLSHSLVNQLELIWPIGGIDDRSHIETVVVAGFGVEMESRRQSSYLVSVLTVCYKEMLDLISKLMNVFIGTFVVQSVEHRHWTQSLDSSQSSKNTQLGIGKSHIFLVSLHDLSFSKWSELGSRNSLKNFPYGFQFVHLIEITQKLS